MKPAVRVLLLVVVTLAGWYHFSGRPVPADAVPAADPAALSLRPADSAAPDAAREAFETQARGRMLRVEGRVTRILADDRDGSPHQRFIIATDSGQTLLVAHNLDLAPRLEGLGTGDRVEVHGEYEWNAQGGLLHWTHDDPAGRHVAGYIQWKGRKYQ